MNYRDKKQLKEAVVTVLEAEPEHVENLSEPKKSEVEKIRGM